LYPSLNTRVIKTEGDEIGAMAHIGEKRNAYWAWLENLKIKDN
jgi:hypothetical protein